MGEKQEIANEIKKLVAMVNAYVNEFNPTIFDMGDIRQMLTDDVHEDSLGEFIYSLEAIWRGR